MRRSARLPRLAAVAAVLAIVLNLLSGRVPFGNLTPADAATPTPPGTQITNNASATYKDAAGNSYSTTSNTVTTTVQNAPTLSLAAATGSAYAPGQLVTDVFTLTNTGNAPGTFQVNGNNTVNASGQFSSPQNAVLGGNNANSGTLGSGPTASSGCGTGASVYAVTISATTTYCDTLADLNTFLSTQSIPVNTAITVNVYYMLAASGENTSNGSNTITSSLYSNVSYAAVTASGGIAAAAAEVSAVSGPATETNTVIAEANLNQFKAQAQCTSSPCSPTTDNVGDVTYTVSAANGGAEAAKDLTSVKTLIGTGVWPAGGGTGGVLLSDKVPQFGGTPLTLSNVTSSNYQITVTTSTSFGFATGAKAYVVYSTSSSAATWALASGGPATGSTTTTFTIPTSAGTIYYVGVLIVAGSCSSTAGYELCPDGTSTTNGNSNVSSAAALSYSFTVAQATSPGSGNTGAFKNVADAVWGDNQPTEHILGPGIASLTPDSGGDGPIVGSNEGINYVSSALVSGASNQTSIQALAAYAVLNGPYDANESTSCGSYSASTGCFGADAAGSYDGTVSSSIANDFTAVPFDTGSGSGDNVVNTSTTAGSPTTSTTTSATLTSGCIKHSLYNAGNTNDTFNLSASGVTQYAIGTTSGTAATGWTVGLYSDSGCASSTTSIAVNSGTVAYYYVKYSAASGQPYFDRFDATITATSQGKNTQTNTTHDELYSGFIALTKSVSVTSSNCPSGESPAYSTGVCPGGVLAYTVDYRNLVMGTSSTNASFAPCISQAGSVTVTEDGTQSTVSNSTTPNWATFTTGLQLAPADNTSNGASRSGGAASTFTYYTGIPATGATSSFTAGATKFVDVVGGSSFQLAPKGYFTSSISGNPTLPVSSSAAIDWQGTITFSLTVK